MEQVLHACSGSASASCRRGVPDNPSSSIPLWAIHSAGSLRWANSPSHPAISPAAFPTIVGGGMFWSRRRWWRRSCGPRRFIRASPILLWHLASVGKSVARSGLVNTGVRRCSGPWAHAHGSGTGAASRLTTTVPPRVTGATENVVAKNVVAKNDDSVASW